MRQKVKSILTMLVMTVVSSAHAESNLAGEVGFSSERPDPFTMEMIYDKPELQGMLTITRDAWTAGIWGSTGFNRDQDAGKEIDLFVAYTKGSCSVDFARYWSRAGHASSPSLWCAHGSTTVGVSYLHIDGEVNAGFRWKVEQAFSVKGIDVKVGAGGHSGFYGLPREIVSGYEIGASKKFGTTTLSLVTRKGRGGLVSKKPTITVGINYAF